MIDIQSIARISGRKSRKRDRALKPVRPSRKSEVQYRAQLLALVATLQKQALGELSPLLKQLEPEYAKDGLIDSLKAAFGRLTTMSGNILNWATRQANTVTNAVLGDVDSRLTGSIKDTLRVDITGMLGNEGAIKTAMQAAVKANIDLITSIPVQYLEKVEGVIVKGMSEGLRHEALIGEIQRIGNVTENRAKLIARDQIGKLNSDFNRVRQTELGIEEYRWSTSNDERVRDEHADLDGQTFRWDDAPPEGHPGEAVQCRCVAIPLFKINDDTN